MKAVIGLDLGTQGVRVLAVDVRGRILARADEKMPATRNYRQPGQHEQDPTMWWECSSRCLRRLMDSLPKEAQIDGMAIDSTSGTVVPADRYGNPIAPALMYNDSRSAPMVDEVRRAASSMEAKLGLSFNSSFAVPKMLWFTRQHPQLAAHELRFTSETDFIVGRLSGSYDRSDFNNMLKFGYDVRELAWPDFIESELGILRGALPDVFAPGTPIAAVSATASQETGVPAGTVIMAGTTDGVAAQLASGATEAGSWNSALGTTLVLKGISRDLVLDPLQRVYSHRHPDAGWMPGGASNTGADWISAEFPERNPEALNQLAASRLPTSLLRYPLIVQGERFPFLCAEARGFTLGKGADELDAYAAGLEGVALLEKMAYDLVETIGAPVSDEVRITEGGAQSALWSTIRATVLNKRLLRPKFGHAAIGAALLAARGVWFDSLREAATSMVEIETEFCPRADWLAPYQEKYERFMTEVTRRGYLNAA